MYMSRHSNSLRSNLVQGIRWLNVHTDEIDDDSPVAEAARGMAEEGHAVRKLVMPHGHDRSSHDHEIAGVDVRVS